MESWQAITGAILMTLGALGGGLKWLLTWLFREIRTIRSDYVQALKEAQGQFLEQLEQKDARIDAEREARLKDKEAHAQTLADMIEQFRDTLSRMKSERPPAPRPRFPSRQ